MVRKGGFLMVVGLIFKVLSSLKQTKQLSVDGGVTYPDLG